MSELKGQLRSLRAMRAGPLRGEFAPPGDRGLAARAFILGTLALGETRIVGYPDSTDTARLIQAMRALGAEIEAESGDARIQGLGVGGLLSPTEPLDLGRHGAAAALVMGLVGLYGFESRIEGDASLATRDYADLIAPLRRLGAIVRADENRFLPATIRGPVTPVPLEIHLHGGQPTTKSALLLAALNCLGTTTIVEPRPTDPLTEMLMSTFGARVAMSDLSGGIRVTEIAGLQDLRGRPLAVPSDPGLALFPIVAALVVPGSTLLLQNVHAAPQRMDVLTTLIEMGADITLINRRRVEGIEFADIRARHSSLRGIDMPSERASVAARDYPLLALAAAFATGTTTLPGLAPAEDWDRLSELAGALNGAGATAERAPDRMVVTGGGRLRGSTALRTHRDPALTLLYLIMGMAARDPVTIDDDSAAPIAYPGFIELFEGLGVRFSRII